MASEKITAMIEEVKALSVLELNELVKALEEEFGVSAAAVAAAPAAGGSCPTARPRWAAWRHSAGPAPCRPCDRCSDTDSVHRYT